MRAGPVWTFGPRAVAGPRAGVRLRAVAGTLRAASGRCRAGGTRCPRGCLRAAAGYVWLSAVWRPAARRSLLRQGAGIGIVLAGRVRMSAMCGLRPGAVDCQLCATVSCARLSAVHGCRPHARLSAAYDCRSCEMVGPASLSAVHGYWPCGTAGCTRLSAICDCQLCTTVSHVRLSAVCDCQLCTIGRGANVYRGFSGEESYW